MADTQKHPDETAQSEAQTLSDTSHEDTAQEDAGAGLEQSRSRTGAVIVGAALLALGGVGGGIIGYGLTHFGPLATAQIALVERVAALEGLARDLQTDVDGAATQRALAAQREASAASIAALGATLAAIEARLAAQAGTQGAPGEVAEGLDAYRDQIARLQAEMEELRAATGGAAPTGKAGESAPITARDIVLAIAEIEAALETGRAFAGPLDGLSTTHGWSIEPSLTAPSQSGVATMVALREAFPDAARAALAAARDGEGEEAGMSGLLRSVFQTRSLEPREGNSTDAILSRAQAHLRDDRLSDALGEVATLPEDAQAAMNDWITQARVRQDALVGFRALAQRAQNGEQE